MSDHGDDIPTENMNIEAVESEEEEDQMDPLEEDAEGEIKLTKDGGIKKIIITRGTSGKKPKKEDEVTVHYVGRLLDGTVFDSSRDRKDPFKFKLGVGQVIKGWDRGVASMRLGEKSKLICAPEYAYGAAGSPPKIPPNSTLEFEVELLSWASASDLTGDGGVVKDVVKEGKGWEKPGDNMEISINAVVTLPDGTVHLNTGGEEPLTLVLGSGTICSGLEKALKAMKKGERASVTLSPEYAKGGWPDVPEGSGASIDIELVQIFKVEDISAKKDGTIMKKTLVESSDWKTANDGAKVKIVYSWKVGTVETPEIEKEFVLNGTHDVPEAIETAVEKMKKGEKALLTLSGAALPADASGSSADALVTLVDFEKTKENWELSTPEKIAAAAVKKDEGNALYKEGKIRKALNKYEKAVSYVENDNQYTDEEKKKCKEVKMSCWLNSAQCHLKEREWTAAIKSATKVLDVDKSNVKALFRRGTAYTETSDYDEAKADLNKALSIEADNKDVQRALAELKKRAAEYERKQKQLYSNMAKAFGV